MEEKKSKILRGQIPTSVFYILFGQYKPFREIRPQKAGKRV